MKKLLKLDTGIFVSAEDKRVYHIVLPAFGFTPRMKKNDYMACGFHEDGSLRVVVAGVPLARAKKMITAWGTPLDPFVDLDALKKSLQIED